MTVSSVTPITSPAQARAPRLARAIARRTRGRAHGRVTRLMSPSDFGETLKPFVFLDLFDHQGAPFERSNDAVEFEALTDTELVLGSAAPHEHALVLGYYSVHTSPNALRDGERQIAVIGARLAQEGRL